MESECTGACFVDRRTIKRNLQTWARSFPYQLGLETVLSRQLGRRRWRPLRPCFTPPTDPTRDWSPTGTVSCLCVPSAPSIGSHDALISPVLMSSCGDSPPPRAASPVADLLRVRDLGQLTGGVSRPFGWSPAATNAEQTQAALDDDKTPAISGSGDWFPPTPGDDEPLDLSCSRPRSPSTSLANLQNGSSKLSRRVVGSPPAKKSYTEEELQAALRDIRSGRLGTRRAAVLYGIPRSTLRNKFYRITALERRARELQEQAQKMSPPPPTTAEEPQVEEDGEEPLMGLMRARLLDRALGRRSEDSDSPLKVSDLPPPGLLGDALSMWEQFVQRMSRDRLLEVVAQMRSGVERRPTAPILLPLTLPRSPSISAVAEATSTASDETPSDPATAPSSEALSTLSPQLLQRQLMSPDRAVATASRPATSSSAAAKSTKGSRPKRGKYRNYNRDHLAQAVRAVQTGEMSVHRAGNHFGVPHSTLEYKVKQRHLERSSRPTSEDLAATGASAPSSSNADKNMAASSGGLLVLHGDSVLQQHQQQEQESPSPQEQLLASLSPLYASEALRRLRESALLGSVEGRAQMLGDVVLPGMKHRVAHTTGGQLLQTTDTS